jgi:uncharacterized membrane protein
VKEVASSTMNKPAVVGKVMALATCANPATATAATIGIILFFIFLIVLVYLVLPRMARQFKLKGVKQGRCQPVENENQKCKLLKNN